MLSVAKRDCTTSVFRRAGQEPFEVAVSGRTVIGNALSLRLAARHGLGPALLPDWLIERDMKGSRLVDLGPAVDCTATPFDTGVWVLYPSRAFPPRKVRVTIDFLREALQFRLAASQHSSVLTGDGDG
jgi:DNA-binding transcriptional LysR family regulator